MTKKEHGIRTSYTLYNQTLVRVHSTQYLGLELRENLHCGKHVQSTAAKADRVNTFAYKTQKGCPPAVQTHRYKDCVHSTLEHTSVVWNPHQQHLKKSISEVVQRWSARHIFHDFSPTSSASARVAQLQLENLRSRRTSDKVCMEVGGGKI